MEANNSDTMLTHGLSTNEILSGIFGSISLTAWICLLVCPFVYLGIVTFRILITQCDSFLNLSRTTERRALKACPCYF